VHHTVAWGWPHLSHGVDTVVGDDDDDDDDDDDEPFVLLSLPSSTVVVATAAAGAASPVVAINSSEIVESKQWMVRKEGYTFGIARSCICWWCS
jgi:hypothetical protein